MPKTTRHTEWEYPLVEVTLDKHATRTGTYDGRAADLVGMDGSLDGGVRPAPGFKLAHTLDPTNERNNPNIGSSSRWASGGAYQSTKWYVSDVRAVDFRVGETDFGYGFIYRVNDAYAGSEANQSILIDYRIGQDPTWYTRELCRLFGNDVDFSVAVWGRLVYLFLEERPPVLFYLTAGTPTLATSSSNWAPSSSVGTLPSYQEVLIGLPSGSGQTGPGEKPVLNAPSETQNIPLGTATNNRIFLSEDGPDTTTPWSSTSSSSGLSEIPQEDEDLWYLSPGEYGFAFYLYDTKTGRRSALSEVAPVQTEDFGESFVGSSSSGSTAQILLNKLAALEVIYDTTKYDQVYMYRTVKLAVVGGITAAGYYFLDKIADLEDFTATNQTGMSGDNSRSIIYYELQDKQLVLQDLFLDDYAFSEFPPPGGEALWYENTMLVSKIKSWSANPPLAGRDPWTSPWAIGETRWSSLNTLSPELFPPNNRYHPATPANEIIRLAKNGPNVIGFSKDRQYLIRKEANYIKFQEMHQGFGVVNKKALDNVGSYIYFVTEKGLKAVDPNGQLEDVKAINGLILDDWVDDYASIEVAFDPLSSIIFVHNSAKFETALFWLTTGVVTTLDDTPFTSLTRGIFPLDVDDPTSNLTTRAFFLHQTYLDHPDYGSQMGAGDTGAARIYVYDYNRSRTISGASSDNGEPRVTLMDTTGDSIFTILGTTSTAVSLTGGTLGDRWEDAYLYCASGSNIGQKTRIRNRSGLSIRVDDASIFNIGDKVFISPIKVKVTMSQLTPQTPDGYQYASKKFFRQLIASSIGCVFSDVSGPPSDTTDAFYRAGVYRGNEPSLSAWGVPEDNTGTRSISVQDTDEPAAVAALGDQTSGHLLQGNYGVRHATLFPSVEIFTPDLDYRLISMLVKGKIDGSDASVRSS